MTPLDTLRHLLRMHQRAAGNTSTALQIAAATNAFFIVAFKAQAESNPIAEDVRRGRIAKNRILTLDNVAEGRYLGTHCPIVVDHFALGTLLHRLDAEFTALQDELRLKSRVCDNQKTTIFVQKQTIAALKLKLRQQAQPRRKTRKS